MPCETVHKKSLTKTLNILISYEKVSEKKKIHIHFQWKFQVFQNTTEEINVFLDLQLFDFLASTQCSGLNKLIAIVKYWEVSSLL